jgi:hypothetical protein
MTRFVVAAMALLTIQGVALAAEGERCKVTDPTGTPLNVRDSPNGKITGTLAHKTKKPIGWVFREFVSCF